MIKRSRSFLEVAFFLSKYGISNPPEILKTISWKEGYRMFYEKLSEGRNVLSFEHSLKNARDTFDSHFPHTLRTGWKDKAGNPNKLTGMSLEVFTHLNTLSESVIWLRISKYCILNSKSYEQEFENAIAIEESEKESNVVKTEGGIKVYISRKVERTLSLRNDALKIHGYDCAVCGFNFERTYGEWGKNWAEVHHLSPISERKKGKTETNPRTDLVVLCANCHRMIHKKKGTALTINELKLKIKNKITC